MKNWPKHYPESLRELQELTNLQRESMMTFDVKQNNWVLPVKGDGIFVDEFTDSLREAGMEIQAGWQRAETFDELNRDWWPAYFSQMKMSDLKELCVRLGVEVVGVKQMKVNYVHALSEFYKARFQ